MKLSFYLEWNFKVYGLLLFFLYCQIRKDRKHSFTFRTTVHLKILFAKSETSRQLLFSDNAPFSARSKRRRASKVGSLSTLSWEIRHQCFPLVQLFPLSRWTNSLPINVVKNSKTTILYYLQTTYKQSKGNDSGLCLNAPRNKTKFNECWRQILCHLPLLPILHLLRP